ncbi:MAG: isoleucine--tRNA ligase [Anaerolineae bacterium]
MTPFEPPPPTWSLPGIEAGISMLWHARRFLAVHDLPDEGSAWTLMTAPVSLHRPPAWEDLSIMLTADGLLRYHRMRGERVRYRRAWQGHGIPFEQRAKADIGATPAGAMTDDEISALETRCQSLVRRYRAEWERLLERMGCWPESLAPLVTSDSGATQSLWWVIASLKERGWLAQRVEAVLFCPQCSIPIAAAGAGSGRRQRLDVCALQVKFPLRRDPATYLLVYTEQAWALPATIALAVDLQRSFVEVERELADGTLERLVLAEDALDRLRAPSRHIVRRFNGKALLKERFLPLYTFSPVDANQQGLIVPTTGPLPQPNTGIVPVAPAVDPLGMSLAREHGLPIAQVIDEHGRFTDEVAPWRRIRVFDAVELIEAELRGRELLDDAETVTREGPVCPHCSSPVIHYATQVWLLEPAAAEPQVRSHLEQVDTVSLAQGIVDRAQLEPWPVGHRRVWGAPMPIWICDQCRHAVAVSSLRNLARASGVPVDQLNPENHEPLADLDAHRSQIDRIVWTCPQCGRGTMRRIPEVADAALDAAAISLTLWRDRTAEQQAPMESLPADVIIAPKVEAQEWAVRAQTLTTALLDRPLCRRLLVCSNPGTPIGQDGERLDIAQAVLSLGADGVRWLLLSGRETSAFEEAARPLKQIWDSYAVLSAAASVADWVPSLAPAKPSDAPLDRWISDELSDLIARVTRHLEEGAIPPALEAIEQFVDALAEWYIPRSTGRLFAREGASGRAALDTLYACLSRLLPLIAPFAPFSAEALYQGLIRGASPEAPASVHHLKWPSSEVPKETPPLREPIALARRLAALGEQIRRSRGIPSRLPLLEAAIYVSSEENMERLAAVVDQLADALGVRRVRLLDDRRQVESIEIHPVLPRLGERYGQWLPRLRAAIAQVDPWEIERAFAVGRPFVVTVGPTPVPLGPDDLEIVHVPRPPYAVAADGEVVVALDVSHPPGMESSILAYAVVDAIEGLRREASILPCVPIPAVIEAQEPLLEVIQAHEDIVRHLAWAEITYGEVADGEATVTLQVDGRSLRVGIRLM